MDEKFTWTTAIFRFPCMHFSSRLVILIKEKKNFSFSIFFFLLILFHFPFRLQNFSFLLRIHIHFCYLCEEFFFFIFFFQFTVLDSLIFIQQDFFIFIPNTKRRRKFSSVESSFFWEFYFNLFFYSIFLCDRIFIIICMLYCDTKVFCSWKSFFNWILLKYIYIFFYIFLWLKRDFKRKIELKSAWLRLWILKSCSKLIDFWDKEKLLVSKWKIIQFWGCFWVLSFGIGWEIPDWFLFKSNFRWRQKIMDIKKIIPENSLFIV